MFANIAARLGLGSAQRALPVPPAADLDMLEMKDVAGFETFGRSGLDIGGLHRDQQWVGAWGGRC